MPTGLEMIAQERADQTETGMDSEDYKWVNGELAYAAASYILRGRALNPKFLPMYWPWGIDRWNPTPHDHRIELAKAGALIAAEIDRLNRKEDRSNGTALASSKPQERGSDGGCG